jgi:hypothetical protein
MKNPARLANAKRMESGCAGLADLPPWKSLRSASSFSQSEKSPGRKHTRASIPMGARAGVKIGFLFFRKQKAQTLFIRGP